MSHHVVANYMIHTLLHGCRITFFIAIFPLLVVGASLNVASAATVMFATYEGVINPVTAEYFQSVLDEAVESNAHLLVFQLDTPGGLDTSMRLIIKEINASPVPVVVFVSPNGGRAASAGVFITMAAHVAAMAHGTNIGAAHPVAMGGGEMDKVMKAKVENDAVAYIKSIAEKRGRNAEWAEDAVRKSVSVTEKEALELGVIDLVVADLNELLVAIDGREVETATGTVVLKTKDVHLQDVPMTWRFEFLKVLSDPNIAYILMTIGTIGIIAELYSPGMILPGVVGAVSLILAFYSFQTLPINYAGLLLMMLGVVLLILEMQMFSYGLLSIGGIAAMILGSVMLMNGGAEFQKVSLSVILPVVLVFAGFILLLTGLAVKSFRRRPVTGAEALVGMTVLAKTDLDLEGQVWLKEGGELWNATSDVPIRVGQEADVTAVKGLRLLVTQHDKAKEGESST